MSWGILLYVKAFCLIGVGYIFLFDAMFDAMLIWNILVCVYGSKQENNSTIFWSKGNKWNWILYNSQINLCVIFAGANLIWWCTSFRYKLSWFCWICTIQGKNGQQFREHLSIFHIFKNYLFSTFIKFILTQSLFFNKIIRWLKIVTSWI